jgi:hypothetical protein
MKDRKKQDKPEVIKEEISRREAMAKMGLAAFSAATMLFLLNNPEKVQAQDDSASADDWDTW